MHIPAPLPTAVRSGPARLFLAACLSSGLAAGSPQVPAGRRSAHYRGPIIDIHCHLAMDPEGDPGGSLPDLLTHMARAGVVRSGILFMAREGELDETRRKNDHLCELASRDPRFIPIGSVHPRDREAALQELERIHARGVKVVKLHPNTQDFDVDAPEVQEIAKKAGELRMILLFDGYKPWDASQFGKFVLLAVTHPETRFIIAHLGGPIFQNLLVLKQLKAYDWFTNNLWLDCSAILQDFEGSPYAEQIVWMLRKIGIDRVLFGSDFPLYSPREAVRAVRSYGFTAGEEARILYGNAVGLLELPGPDPETPAIP